MVRDSSLTFTYDQSFYSVSGSIPSQNVVDEVTSPSLPNQRRTRDLVRYKTKQHIFTPRFSREKQRDGGKTTATKLPSPRLGRCDFQFSCRSGSRQDFRQTIETLDEFRYNATTPRFLCEHQRDGGETTATKLPSPRLRHYDFQFC